LRIVACDEHEKSKAAKYRSRLSAAIHGTAAGLHRIGLMDKETMRELDATSPTAVEPLSAKEIAAIRKRAGVSQGVFAHYLNVKPKLVSEWERGEKRPSGPSVKLPSIVKTKGLDAIS
jgi:putative transcriptional regulator